jgi:general secretion pathway protein F
MGTFRYEALDEHGKTRAGVVEGDSPRLARDRLREDGLTPLELSEMDSADAFAGLPGTGGRLSASERAVVLRQLATLTIAGLPLEDALGTVAEQSAHAGTQAIFGALKTQVREGSDFAGALRCFPAAFTEEIVAAVAAGEQSGSLGLVLSRLADFAERRQTLGREIGLALLYPVIVVVVAIGVVLALMTFVVPRVVRVFDHAGQELPFLTRVLIAVSDALAGHWLLLGGGLLAVSAVLVWLLRRPAVRGGLQAVALRIPLLGRALRAGATSRFCRSLSLQVASGVPLVEALQVSAAAPGLQAMRESILAAAQQVREGVNLSVALGKAEQFPPLAMRLIASGEQSGQLASMLDHAAEAQEREATALATGFSAILQPVLILLVGVFVLLIVLAIMLPILNLNQLLS